MSNEKVAIIIPNFNKQDYLNSCLESAIRQTYPNLEIIVIDDCSTDGSIKIIKNFAKQYANIKAFFLTTNHGVSYARNFGASKTNARYIIFLDSDDIYMNPDKISNEMKFASNKTIVFSQWVPMKKNGQIMPYKTFKHNPYRFFAISKILSISLPPAQQLRGYLISKELFNRVGKYNEKSDYLEDFDFQCRLCLEAKIKYTKDVGEAYRQNTGGLSKRSEEFTLLTIKKIQKKYYKKLNLLQRAVFRRLNKY